MDKELVIRLAKTEDYSVLCEMSKESKHTRDFSGVSYRFGWKGKVFLAEVDGEIAGFYYFSILKTRPYSNFYFLYVRPSFRGLKIGSKLFTHSLAESRKAGKDYMKWKAHRENEEAVKFYKRLGFIPSKRADDYFNYKERL